MFNKFIIIKKTFFILNIAILFSCYLAILVPIKVSANNFISSYQIAVDTNINTGNSDVPLSESPTSEPSVTTGRSAAEAITLTGFLQTFYIYLSRFTLIASFLMIVLAIYVYMTSSGDATKIKKSREYLTSAIIGMIAVAFAYTFFEILNPDILNLKP